MKISKNKIEKFIEKVKKINKDSYLEVVKLLNDLNINLEPRAIGELLHCLKESNYDISLILTDGISRDDLISLKHANSEWLIPRLELFKKMMLSFPLGLTEKEWEEIINKMIFSHQMILNDNVSEKNWDQVKEGIDLYCKYYFDLWS